MKRQQGIAYQLDLFPLDGSNLNTIRHSENCETVSGANERQESQVNGAGQQERALANCNLMQVICSTVNIRRAYKRVKQNKGAAGIDQMVVGNFADWFKDEGENLINSLQLGTYQPTAVKLVEIPKPNGGLRILGIPTVTDRIIQQAIAQVLTQIYDPLFSDHSYGFREKRNAHQALKKASVYVEDGRTKVVDIDLKTFFDLVNHDRLMYELSTKIGDKILLKLIRKYLQTGILKGGIVSQRLEGTPQGSPLSPLLSNIVLDELDRELEKRGHKFVRYADDCNIFVRSQEAGERVMQSVSNFIENKLKLVVNKDKSKACDVNQTKFLGYTIQKGGWLSISKQNQKRFKDKIRLITKRNRGRSFEQVLSELNPVLRGWLQYFQYARCSKLIQDLDSWIRRKLRCYRIKQCKRVFTLQQFLKRLGVKNWSSWLLALSGKGHWRKSRSPQVQHAMNNEWFEEQGLYNLAWHYEKFKSLKKPPCARACTVV
jgi:group II intron reverse transcriptase/maturase